MRQKAICLVLALSLVGAGCNRGRTVVGSVSTVAALTMMQLIVPSSAANVQTLFTATLFTAVIGVLVLHTVLSVPSKVPELKYTEIGAFGALTVLLSLAVLVTLFQNIAASQPQGEGAVAFPEGQSENGLTIHATTEVPMPEGDYHLFHMNCGNVIPLVSPGFVYQYAFVMDSDGVAENNYMTADNDFFNDSDRWYEVSYNDVDGWTLTVKTAFDNEIVEVASAARVIIKSNAMVLVVPASEFTVAQPDFRVTAFCHTGDFGIPEPHNWSGDLHPTVAEGLRTFPEQPFIPTEE